MSKLLLDKINNILEINENDEYINLDCADTNEYIYLQQFLPTEGIIHLINTGQYTHIFNNNYEQLLNELKMQNSYNELNIFLSNLGYNDFYELVQNKYYNNNVEYLLAKINIYKDFKVYLSTNEQIFKNLNKIAFKKFVATGKQLLRIATHFIYGKINDKQIYGPLFLFDVNIDVKENEVNFQIASPQILNEKLLIYIAKELNLNYKTLNFDSIQTKNDFKNLIEPYLQYSVDDYQDNQPKTDILKFYNIFVLGLFDVKPGKIKEDFVQIMNQNVDLFNKKMVNDVFFYQENEFEKEALAQINRPLNIYQKYAVRSAINENTLIYGPPGTGKSEIISSIIANLLINSKTGLIVSEKTEALDVIKQRLKKISKFVLYLKDIEDENLFYDGIHKISELMGNFYNGQIKPFNIADEYKNNERVIDYNKTISKFRDFLNDDIQFSLKKDSRNNDYKDYLISIKIVESFIDNNIEAIQEYWNQYKNKFVKLQTPTDFIAKVAEFNFFKEYYELQNDEINRIEQIRIEINRFISEYNILDRNAINYESVNKNNKKFIEFLNKFSLNKDRDFISMITSNHAILEQNYRLLSEINQLIDELPEKKMIINFLLSNVTRHEKFLNKYFTLDKRSQALLLNRYWYKRELIPKKVLFKPKKSEQFTDIFIHVIQLFTKVVTFKNNNYLKEITNEDIETVSTLTVFMYCHQDEYIKKPVLEYYAKQIVNFDNRMINEYYKYRVNKIERELININNYQYEILSKNKHIVERDIPELIDRYLKDNHDFTLNMDEAISETYTKYLRYRLSQCDQTIKDKLEKMFKIINLEIRPNINDFILEFSDCLRLIFPIWISKPGLISFYIENQPNIFDIGIFDEASQMFLERAYPILYRCKSYIIAGDDKQTKPERLIFNELDINDIANKPLIKDIDFDYSESLLDRARVCYWNTFTLRNHYRSVAKELIEFSNLHFYDNKLLFSTINKNKIPQPLEVIDTDFFDANENNGINLQEANQVISYIQEYINKFDKILVICFSPEQRTYIFEQLKKDNNSLIVQKLKQGFLKVKDVNNVQGDEAHLVILSTVFTKKSNDFGTITKPRGQNYLNVVITRAIEKMVVIKSLKAEDVTFDFNETNPDKEIFKVWLAYLDDKKERSQNKNSFIQINDHSHNSTFKNNVYETIQNDPRFSQFNLIQNLKTGSTTIDIAICNQENNGVELAIILDDYKKNIDIQSWFEDIDNQEYLKSRNYDILRIREQDWFIKSNQLVNNIFKRIQTKLCEEGNYQF